MSPSTRLVSRAGLVAMAALLLIAPITVTAHAELDVATPPEGAKVDGSPPEVSGLYTQDIKPDGSSIQLRDAQGQVIGAGGVDPANPRRMAIQAMPELAPGKYEVRWTTISAEDGELARDTWSFTVLPPPSTEPTSEPTATPSPTAAASAVTSPPASPSAVASSAPSATTSAAPSIAASAASSVAPSAAATPTPSGDTGQPAASTSDVLLPIIAGLAIVVVVAVLLARRRNRPTPPA